MHCQDSYHIVCLSSSGVFYLVIGQEFPSDFRLKTFYKMYCPPLLLPLPWSPEWHYPLPTTTPSFLPHHLPPPIQRLCPAMSPSLLAPTFLSSTPGCQGLLIPAWPGQEGELPSHRLVERNGAPRKARTPPTWPGLPASFNSRSCLSVSRSST